MTTMKLNARFYYAGKRRSPQKNKKNEYKNVSNLVQAVQLASLQSQEH